MIKSKRTGEFHPTEDDVKNLELWISNQEKIIMLPNKFPNETSSCGHSYKNFFLGKFNSFYQSDVFPFIMKSDKGQNTVNFKFIKSEKNFRKFINNSQYLIHRCLVFDNPCPNTNQKYFGVYYHRDFGKVGWLKSRLQFQLQKFCSEGIIQWFYGIKKFKFPYIQINISNKSCD